MPKKSWGWVGLCFALMLPIFALGLARNLSAAGPQVHLAPFAVLQVTAAALGLALIPAIFLIGLVVTRRWWWGAGSSVIGLQVLGLVGGAALMTVTSPDFLFGPTFLRTERSGPRAAHIYRAEFLICRWDLYLGAADDPVVPEVASVPCRSGVDPQVAWREDGGVELVQPDGGPL
jgi:hypothetical protein